MKKCFTCGTQSDNDFYQSESSRCKACTKTHTSQWVAKNPERVKANSALRQAKYRKSNPRYGFRFRLKRYGLTEDIYNQMLSAQEHKCPICLDQLQPGSSTVIDHNHETREVRKILCRKCNSGIGMLRDDAELAARAADYLKSYPGLCRLLTQQEFEREFENDR